MLEAISDEPLVHAGTITFADTADGSKRNPERPDAIWAMHMQATNAEPIPLARAAPSIPIPRGPMNSQSSAMLMNPPVTDEARASVGDPETIANCIDTNCIIINGTNGAKARQYSRQ